MERGVGCRDTIVIASLKDRVERSEASGHRTRARLHDSRNPDPSPSAQDDMIRSEKESAAGGRKRGLVIFYIFFTTGNTRQPS